MNDWTGMMNEDSLQPYVWRAETMKYWSQDSWKRRDSNWAPPTASQTRYYWANSLGPKLFHKPGFMCV